MKPACLPDDSTQGSSMAAATRCGSGFFTLVELLVVIAIIGVLVGLSAPVLSRARQTVRRSVCESQLRQIYIAMEAYSLENHGFFPHHATADAGELGMLARGTTIWEILSLNQNVFNCPGDRENMFRDFGSSYIWNWMQIELPGNGRTDASRYDTTPFGGIVRPEKFAIMSDFGAYHGKLGSINAFNVLYANGRVGNWSESTIVGE